MAPRHDVRLEVMGTIAHVVTIGDGGDELVEGASAHLRELEARWSRFESSSEISRLNASAGVPLVVSPPTIALIELGIEGWRVTNGCFDPTVLGDVMRAGYDRSFCEITDATARGATSSFQRGCDGIEVDPTSSTVRLPTGVGVDPGGIGKGLAADLVIDALCAAGAEGACVNVGGDVRVAGASPGDSWVIELSRAGCSRPREAAYLVDGAVATSAPTYRSWFRSGSRKHHLIDPRTGAPIDNDIVSVSVAAARGWQADVLTKAIFVAGVRPGLELAEELDAAALVVTDDDMRHTSRQWCNLVPPLRVGHV
jgi:FAD:protein FMN transferase